MPTLSNLFVIVDLAKRCSETESPCFWSKKNGWVPLNSLNVTVSLKCPTRLPRGENVRVLTLDHAVTLVSAYYEAVGSGNPEHATEMEMAIMDYGGGDDDSLDDVDA